MSVRDFKAQKVYEPSVEELKKIKRSRLMKIEEIPDIDNTDIYEWVQIGRSKNVRFMYCMKTGIKRFCTMGEFYGASEVD